MPYLISATVILNHVCRQSTPLLPMLCRIRELVYFCETGRLFCLNNEKGNYPFRFGELGSFANTLLCCPVVALLRRPANHFLNWDVVLCNVPQHTYLPSFYLSPYLPLPLLSNHDFTLLSTHTTCINIISTLCLFTLTLTSIYHPSSLPFMPSTYLHTHTHTRLDAMIFFFFFTSPHELIFIFVC